jgi:tetratricopeptide (TPR) repeat protein
MSTDEMVPADEFNEDAADASENAELLALQRIDETCVSLQEQGRYLEALECMERGLVLRQHFFGAESDEVWRACKTVGEMCNLLAMTYLQQDDFAMVLELLKKAEILTERDQAGRAVTFNNLACYYRRQGKLHSALSYMQKALRIESRLEKVDNPADTHLNMCAVLSQLGRHAGALEHAQSALILLQEELFSGAVGGDGMVSPVAQKVDRVAVLAIAYHNIGVEQEFLKRLDQSLHSYRKGVEIAETHLGHDHGITITIRSSYIAAKRAVAARRSKRKSSSHGKSNRHGEPKQHDSKQRSRHAAGSRVSPTKAEEKRWDTISSAYGDIPGVTPVRADEGRSSSTMMENPEDEELPSAMAAAQHGIKVENTGSSGDGGGNSNGESIVEKVEVRGSGNVGMQNLDSIIGGGPDLEAMISPRPGEKGAAPSDEGKAAEEEGKAADEGKSGN